MVAQLSTLLGIAALYIVLLAVRYSRRQDRSHRKFQVLISLLEKTYAGHAQEVPEAGEEEGGTPRRDSERR